MLKMKQSLEFGTMLKVKQTSFFLSVPPSLLNYSTFPLPKKLTKLKLKKLVDFSRSHAANG